jgi:hypothetical protein
MRVVRGLMLIALTVLSLPTPAQLHGQQARRGGGLRVGAWNVDVDPWVERSADFDAFYQRALGDDLALENSLSGWRAVVNQTRAYIVPLLTSLKYYPVSSPADRVEPYVMGGVGIAFGIQDEPDNAIGGTGSTIVTGVALRTGLGVEVRVFRGLGVAASGKYQWVHFGDDVGTMQTFAGVGWAGAVVYRFDQ